MMGGICEPQSVDRFLLEGRRHIGRRKNVRKQL